MTLSTLVSDSSDLKFKKIKEAIVKECGLSKKYELLNQTTYFFEGDKEVQTEITKADIHDKIILLNSSGEIVKTSSPLFESNNWTSMIKYREGAKLEEESETWFTDTKFPDTLGQADFYEYFWFSSNETQSQINQFGRTLTKYDPVTDSFVNEEILDWDTISIVRSSVVIQGMTEPQTTQTKSIIQAQYPNSVIGDDLLLVFSGNGNLFVLVGEENYRWWNTSGTTGTGFRGAFQTITQSQFDAHKVTIA